MERRWWVAGLTLRWVISLAGGYGGGTLSLVALHVIAVFSIQQKSARRIRHLADFRPVQVASFSPDQLARLSVWNGGTG
jgi:hypothetical protein